jgi:CheY-like chemotaxis protein
MDSNATRGKGPRILCVDDDEDGRAVCVAALEREGFIVFEASNGNQALALARDVVPDLVMLDLALPGMDGWTVAEALKRDSETAKIHIVAFTAIAYPSDRARALAAGCEAFLEKPADLASIVGVVRRIIDNEPPERRAIASERD